MIDASLTTLSNAFLLQTGLQAQAGGTGLFQQAGDMLGSPRLSDAIPYIATGAGVFTAASVGTWAIVRLLRHRQANLPPAGMTDIPPRRMNEFFDAHAKDGEAITRLFLGFRTEAPSKASGKARAAATASLAETRRRIADEISELTETIAALDHLPNSKKRDIAVKARDAYQDLAVFAALRAGEKTRAREAFLNAPLEIFVSIAKALKDLDDYRTVAAAKYFKDGYEQGVGALPGERPNREIAVSYKSMGPEANRIEARRAIRAWQSLTPAQRNVFWSLARSGKSSLRDPSLRDPMIAPSFLFVYLQLRNSPELAIDAAKQETKLDELLRAEVVRIEATRGLPAHVRNMNHAMVMLRHEVERRGGLHSQPSALLMTPVKIKSEGGVAKVQLQVNERVFEVAPEEILMTRDENYRAGDTSWMHPDVVRAYADTPEAQRPRLALDLSVFPAPSLGDGHKVVVDMEERRMKEFLERLRPYRERLETSAEPRALIAGEIWRAFGIIGGKPDAEKLRAAAGPGNVHSLFDLTDNGAVIERAILVQIAFQYVGIRSGIEKNTVTVVNPKDATEISMGLQLWVRMWLSSSRPKDASILQTQIRRPLPDSDLNFARFVDQPSHVGAPPSDRTSTSTSASGPRPLTPPSENSDVTPLPAPAPQIDDDDDESNRPTVIPAAPVIPTQTPTIPAPAPLPSVPAGSEPLFPAAAAPYKASDEPTQQIDMRQLKGMAIRAELTVELRDHFRALNSDDVETTQFVGTIAKAIFDAWDLRGRPATEFDVQGNPTRIPENVFEEEMENWLRAKEGSTFAKDKADAAALRASNQGSRSERAGLAVRKPLSQPPAAAQGPIAGTPPASLAAESPDSLASQDAQRDIRNLMFRRYPALRDEIVAKLVVAFVNNVYKKEREEGGATPEKRMERIISEVRGALKPLRSRPRFQRIFEGLLASEGIWDELREYCPAFGDTHWSEALEDALQSIYSVWDRSERTIETSGASPSKMPLIPESVFEEGYGEFFKLLRKRYPNVPVEVLKQTFVDNNNGPRAVRWAPPEEVAEDAVIDISPEDDDVDVESPTLVPPSVPQTAPAPSQPVPQTVPSQPAPLPQPTTSEVSNVRVRPAAATVADVSARLFERYPFFLDYTAVARAIAGNVVKAVEAGSELGAVLDVELGNLFLHLANTPRPTPKEEAILKGIAETDLVRTLRDNYAFFRDPKRPQAAIAQAREIYKVWNANNRTFDGNQKVRPLRVPERFVEEAMDKLINFLHATNRPLADAIAGSRVDRPSSRRDSSRPPAPIAIPISEETIYLELLDRVPEFASNKGLNGNAKFLAATIHKTWLQKDPTRLLERSGSGLNGFVPEAILDEKLIPFLAYLRTTKVPVTDRGAREKRGTGVLERIIQKRTAAA